MESQLKIAAQRADDFEERSDAKQREISDLLLKVRDLESEVRASSRREMTEAQVVDQVN